jgi:hypothetical protein
MKIKEDQLALERQQQQQQQQQHQQQQQQGQGQFSPRAGIDHTPGLDAHAQPAGAGQAAPLDGQRATGARAPPLWSNAGERGATAVKHQYAEELRQQVVQLLTSRLMRTVAWPAPCAPRRGAWRPA